RTTEDLAPDAAQSPASHQSQASDAQSTRGGDTRPASRLDRPTPPSTPGRSDLFFSPAYVVRERVRVRQQRDGDRERNETATEDSDPPDGANHRLHQDVGDHGDAAFEDDPAEYHAHHQARRVLCAMNHGN